MPENLREFSALEVSSKSCPKTCASFLPSRGLPKVARKPARVFGPVPSKSCPTSCASSRPLRGLPKALESCASFRPLRAFQKLHGNLREISALEGYSKSCPKTCASFRPLTRSFKSCPETFASFRPLRGLPKVARKLGERLAFQGLPKVARKPARVFGP